AAIACARSIFGASDNSVLDGAVSAAQVSDASAMAQQASAARRCMHFIEKPLKAAARHRRDVSDGSARESLYQRGGARGEGCSSRSGEGANSCSLGVN